MNGRQKPKSQLNDSRRSAADCGQYREAAGTVKSCPGVALLSRRGIDERLKPDFWNKFEI